MTEKTLEPEAARAGMEALLLSEGAVSEEQLNRARRITRTMSTPRTVGEVLVELGQLANTEHERIKKLHRSTLSLVEILSEDGALDEDGVMLYEAHCRQSPDATVRTILVDRDIVTEEQYLKALSAKHDIPYVEPEISLIDRELLTRTSIPWLRRQRALPMRVVDGALHAIVADPLNERLMGELQTTFGVRIEPCCAPVKKIVEALTTLDRLRETGQDDSQVVELQYQEVEGGQAVDDEEKGAVRIVDYLLSRAIKLGASDLHIEPLESKIRVRVRVDGILRNLTDLPHDFAARIASRLKVLAGCDITERRRHQDGRIFARFDGSDVDIRVSCYVSMFGETIVMRLLDRRRGLVPLDKLGFQPRVHSILMDVILRTSSGMVLMTGPTGSGKTTTLYSFIDYVKDGSQKVITCEDPVEYVLDGITQCHVNEKSGPTFAESLRSIVRQDPDIIVVGEIRNEQTAELATQCALTGHKVFSTFHTEDSVGVVVRLLEMGLEPFLIASTLTCVVAQRLARRICEHCVEPDAPEKRNLHFLKISREEARSMSMMRGKGCDRCDDTGFAGRLCTHELLWPDDEFRDAILRRASTMELRQLARKLPGFLTLQEDGLLKVADGKTSLSEVVDNTPRDPDARPLAVLREIANKRRTK